MEREYAIEVIKIAAFTIIAVAAIIGGAFMYGSHVRAQATIETINKSAEASIQRAEANIRAMEAKTRELQAQAAELNRENLRLQQEIQILKGQAMLMDKLQREPIPVQVKAGDGPDR